MNEVLIQKMLILLIALVAFFLGTAMVITYHNNTIYKLAVILCDGEEECLDGLKR